MVGYALGLGDRHSGNILLHTASAEVLHIDLGIAFEQVRAFGRVWVGGSGVWGGVWGGGPTSSPAQPSARNVP